MRVRDQKKHLGATEIMDSEIRGQTCFAKSVFTALEHHRYSHWLNVVDEMFEMLAVFGARVFMIWTTDPTLLTLRNPATRKLSEPYKQLLFDFRGLMENEAPNRLGSLNFDLRGTREDEATAAAITNYMVRTKGGWGNNFVFVPDFTVSSVSPGLQAADMITYLGPHLFSNDDRPELKPYIGRMIGLRYEFVRPGKTQRRVRTVRRVR